MSVDLVIFDCDGVLVDSEALSCRVHSDMLTRHGYAITTEQVHDRFLGRSAREARLEIETELGRALPDAYGVEMKLEITRVFTESLQPVAQIRETLAMIEQPVCVASSGTPERIRSSLLITGLLDEFAPHIFSAMQVENGKPAPDLFLFAAREMGVAPERCVVIEDSVPGVIGAVAAGMTALGFCGGAHCRPGHAKTLRAAGASADFSAMSQLPAMIERICEIRNVKAAS